VRALGVPAKYSPISLDKNSNVLLGVVAHDMLTPGTAAPGIGQAVLPVAGLKRRGICARRPPATRPSFTGGTGRWPWWPANGSTQIGARPIRRSGLVLCLYANQHVTAAEDSRL